MKSIFRTRSVLEVNSCRKVMTFASAQHPQAQPRELWINGQNLEFFLIYSIYVKNGFLLVNFKTPNIDQQSQCTA